MTRTKLWVLGAAGVALVVLVAGWFLLVSPKRGEAADLRAQNEQQLTENASLREQLETLRRQAKQLPAKRARLAELAEALPDDPKLPTLIRTLSATAEIANADLTNIAPGPPTVVGDTSATGTTTGTTSGTTGTTPSAGGVPSSGQTGTPQLQAVPLTLTVSGEYAEVDRFLSRLEQVDRTFVLTGFTLARSDAATTTSTGTTSGTTGTSATTTGEPSAGRGPVKLDLTGQVFMVSAAPPAAVGESPTTTPPSGTTGGG